jgi:hypothetical protein
MSHSGYEHPAKAMNRLAFLEGDWEGQGWYQAGPDAKRRHFTQKFGMNALASTGV